MAPTYPPIMLATVLDVDALAGGGDAVFVDCPTIAPGRRMGPLLTSVPGLAKGDAVILATVGYARDAVQVIARTHSKFPGVDDIPDLRTELDGRLRREDASDLTLRLDTTSTTLGDHAEALALHDRRLNRLGADDDALRRSLAVARANIAALQTVDTQTASALAALRTAMFGGPDRTRPPAAFVYWVADSGTLGVGNYLMTSGWAKEDTDPDGMITLGSSGATEIKAPVAGKYVLEWDAVSTATSGALYARHAINPDSAATLNSQVANSSLTNFAQLGAPEATHLHGQVTRNLAAGDRIQATLYSTVQFVLKAGWFGQLRQTRWGIRYVGPAQT